MRTLILSKQDVAALLSLSELITALKRAYVTYSTDMSVKAQRMALQVQETSIVINAPGSLPSSPMLTVKINAKAEGNTALGLPFLIGTILLLDQKTGQLLAILDSALITAMRTGAAGAIGIAALAQSKTGKIGLIGAGVQGEWQIRSLHAIGLVKHVTIYDIVSSQSKKLAYVCEQELGLTTTIVSTIKEAVALSDVIITTTQSKTPLITIDMLHPGLHINAFGADQPGKIEIDKAVLTQATIVADDKKLAFTDGALNVPFQQTPPEQPLQEIGEILLKPEIFKPKNITIYANVGLAFQDLVACTLIYQKALELKRGQWIELDSSISAQHSTSHLKAKL